MEATEILRRVKDIRAMTNQRPIEWVEGQLDAVIAAAECLSCGGTGILVSYHSGGEHGVARGTHCNH